MVRPAVEQVWSWLGEVPDPEIPVISLTDLGIIRDVAYEGETLVVTVTPTYSGCPATSVINLEIEKRLAEEGVTDLRLKRQLSPPWTTDWIAPAARNALKAYGIAPPIDGTAADGVLAGRIARLTGANTAVETPALRIDPDRDGQPLRLDPLQGGVPMPRLPGTLRLFQVYLR